MIAGFKKRKKKQPGEVPCIGFHCRVEVPDPAEDA